MWKLLSCGVSTEQHEGKSITELITVWLDDYLHDKLSKEDVFIVYSLGFVKPVINVCL